MTSRSSSPAGAPSAGARPDVTALEARFREITRLMYDTRVPRATLEERAIPLLALNVEFVDPWLRARTRRVFAIGLRGFHCVIRFDFDIFQLGVHLNERGDGGHAIVDGVMNLRQLGFYTYPLRTILVYDFVLSGDGEELQITKLEEMWGFGDMIANAPLLVGHAYDGILRPAWGHFFTGLFWLACKLFEPPVER
jgi:hypothetical protein